MVLNVFSHSTGLEVGSFFDESAPSISTKMSEYTGEPSDLTVQQIPEIPSVLVGNEMERYVCVCVCVSVRVCTHTHTHTYTHTHTHIPK